MFRVKPSLCVALVAGMTLLFGCSEPEMPGLDLQPVSEQPGIFVTDTLTIHSYCVEEDSLVAWSTTKNAIEAPTLYTGTLNDPDIGTTNAGFVTQVRIGNTITSTTFAGLSTPDSVVLVMGYKEIIGDTSAQHHFRVYELGEKLYVDSVYYTSRTYTSGNLLGEVTLRPDIDDSVKVGTVTSPPQLRLPLDTAFGGRLMREYANNPGTFADNTAFLAYLKGLKVESDANGSSSLGSIVTLMSASSLDRLILYYNSGSSYEFLIDGSCVRMPYFSHNYLPAFKDNVADDVMAVSSMAGLKDSLVIPNLRNLYDNGPVSINQAQLVVKMKDGSNNVIPQHTNLLILASDSLGLNQAIIDNSESSSYYDGNYASGEYHINIARHVQRLLKTLVEDGGKDYGLFLVPGGSMSNARRSLLKGNADLKLIVTYTKVNP